MTSDRAADQPADHPPRDPRPPVSWALVAGLGALALLRPLAQLTGVAEALGAVTTAVLVVVIVAVVWIGVVGLGRVPRPVLTLMLAGAAYGTVLVVLSAALRPEQVSVLTLLVAAVLETARATALGAVAGVLALAVQRIGAPR